MSLICLWLVRHVVALPKVIQGPCFANREDACMGTCHKYHVMDALLVTFAIMPKHHLVTHSICWIFYYFFMATDLFIMLWLCYSSFRCLHGECRYTTDLTRVGVTLDYVAVSNQSLTQTISLFCTFSKLPWCNGAPFGSLISLLVQPFYNVNCERRAICCVLSQGLVSTGLPSNCWVPMLDDVQASISACVALTGFCFSFLHR